jgi:trk system potassium uptake protein TrkA
VRENTLKSMLVIGLGRFGRHLSRRLAELGNEVMIVDKDEDRVAEIAPFVTTAHVADCQDEDVVRELGVTNFDVCFVCVSDDFQSSLEITSNLKEVGAKRIVSKADRERQGKFLEKIGADEVIHAEKAMAQRLADKYSNKNVFDYIELSQDYAIAETLIPKEWIGHTVHSLAVRTKYNVNILGYKSRDLKLVPVLKTDHVFTGEEHIILAGLKKDVAHIAART